MPFKSRLSTAFLVGLFATTPALAEDMSADDLVAALQDGGHVLYIRHASTESDYADQIDAVMGDCSTQRVLSEDGWAEARQIGAAFERLDIPVNEVISSEYCRAWQTAALAFGRYKKASDLNFEPDDPYTDEQMAAMSERLTPHLSTVPPEAANTVLVGHDDPFEAATGIYPEPMGVTYVLRPAGDGEFEVLGHIPLADWESVDG